MTASKNFGMSFEELECVLTIVGVEHLTAEVPHDVDGGGTDLRHVLNRENANRFSGQQLLPPEHNSWQGQRRHERE